MQKGIFDYKTFQPTWSVICFVDHVEFSSVTLDLGLDCWYLLNKHKLEQVAWNIVCCLGLSWYVDETCLKWHRSVKIDFYIHISCPFSFGKQSIRSYNVNGLVLINTIHSNYSYQTNTLNSVLSDYLGNRISQCFQNWRNMFFYYCNNPIIFTDRSNENCHSLKTQFWLH